MRTKSNGKLRSFLLWIFVVSLIHSCSSKWVEGVLETNENWGFITRFCFLTRKGSLEYDLRYPVGYGTQNLLLYHDTPGQWDSIYKTGKTCEEKVAVLDTGHNQLLSLNTSWVSTSKYSGCRLITYQGDTWYRCQGIRTFQSSRERWWYIAAGRCGSPKDEVVGLKLHYKIHMTNGDDLLHQEYSADEFYIFPVDVAFFIVYIILCCLSTLCAVILRRKQLFHTTYKLYISALGLWTGHLLLMVIAWGYYGETGWELDTLEVTGRVLRSASTVILILMLILISKGYSITRGRLSMSSTVKVTVFIVLYTVIMAGLFIWEAKMFDPGKVLYYYESPAGYGMITMHLIGWLWFLYSTVFTIKHCSKKFQFYVPFFTFYTIWFWAGPVVILIGMFVMARWSREKTVNGVELLVNFLGHVFFLALTRPSAANSNFPYTIRTSQIATMSSEDEVARDGNPYIISSQVNSNNCGPNLELFITSKNEESRCDVDQLSTVVQAGHDASSSCEEEPPPSYPQIMGLSAVVLPPLPRQSAVPTTITMTNGGFSFPESSSVLSADPQHPTLSHTPIQRGNVLPPLERRMAPSAPLCPMFVANGYQN